MKNTFVTNPIAGYCGAVLAAVAAGVVATSYLLGNPEEDTTDREENFVPGISMTYTAEQSIGTDPQSSTSDVGQQVSRMARAGSLKAAGFPTVNVEGTYQSLGPSRFDGSGNGYGPLLRTDSKTSGSMKIATDPSKTLTQMGDFIDGGGQVDTYVRLDETFPSTSGGGGSLQAQHAQAMADKKKALDQMMAGDGSGGKQPIVYERYIYANRNSRLRAGGDSIRGDLPIIPEPCGWFRVSARPNVDLQQGAMNVLAGPNEATRKLQDLIFKSSGGADYTMAGVNLANDTKGYGMAGAGDIQLTNFP